jgi:hypothetical protein
MQIFWVVENSPERFFRIFRELCSVETEPDGLRFDPDTVTAERIAQDADYEGVRVSFTAYLERAKTPIQIDIGFGDAVTPPPVDNNYPTLLGSTAPRPLTRCAPLFCQFLLLERKREKPMGPGKVAIHPGIPQPHVLDCLYHPTVRPPNPAPAASAPAESATGAQREPDRSDTQKGFDWNCPIS